MRRPELLIDWIGVTIFILSVLLMLTALYAYLFGLYVLVIIEHPFIVGTIVPASYIIGMFYTVWKRQFESAAWIIRECPVYVRR